MFYAIATLSSHIQNAMEGDIQYFIMVGDVIATPSSHNQNAVEVDTENFNSPQKKNSFIHCLK